MPKTKILTPDYVQQIITDEETPLRGKKFAPPVVNEVLRYGAFVGSVIEHHEQIYRAMERARGLIRHAEELNRSFHSGTVILADEMIQSRGRFKRPWHAPRGGLWMTLVLVNTLLPEKNLLIPLAAGVACCELLRYYGTAAHIKWVNDIIVDNKKIAGILTETFTGRRFGEEYVLVGIGINVNNNEFPAEFSEQATSLKTCLHKEITIAEMAARLLAKLRWNIGLLHYEEARYLEVHGGMAQGHCPPAEYMPGGEHLLLESYKNLTDIFNRRVLFGFDVQKNPQFEATVVGLENSGGLVLELDDSSRIVQHGGEIIYLD